MADDRRLRISSSRAHPDEVARHTFGTTRRGFDPAEVRSYLEVVAAELAGAAERERELRELLAEAEHRAANPVLDEATLTASLGQETARVLRSAHDAAADVVARAEGEAEVLRSSALEESSALRERAETAAAERTSQAEAAVDELKRRAQDETTASLDKARLEAEALLTQARAECRAMVQEAQELRAKVLADLTRRRRVLHSQIEQLRAGRERLAETITGVRGAVDAIADDLFRAEDEARLAAEEAGRQVAASVAAEPEAEAATEAGTEVGTEAEAEDLALAAAADVLVAPDAGDAGEAHAPGEPVAAAGGPEPEEQDEEARRQAVEDLFARLRANAPEDLEPPSADAPAAPAAADTGAAEPTAAPSVAAVAEVPVDTAPAKAPKEPKERAPRERAAKRAPAKAAAAAGKPAAEPAAASSAQPVAVSEPAAAGAPAAEGADEGDGVAIDPDLARRDEVLTPVVTAMARRLKRALQDDQNDILDRLRASGRWGPEVLPSVEDHLARYSAAAADQLAQASGLGASFAGGGVGAAPDVSVLSNELALSIVVPLRRRLDGEDAPADSGDDALADRVGAAFREWKGARIERLAGDEAVAAFGAATLAAAAAGSSWRWVVDDGGDECPDCDDNALAGPTPPGEEYPTGHVHPPAHAGCRCLIAPVTT